MRLFNKNLQFAFEWLPKTLQDRFPEATRNMFSASGKADRRFKPDFVRTEVFGEKEKAKVRDDIDIYYSDLCNYSHPNFQGWKELISVDDEEQERIQNMPTFRDDTAELGVGVALFSMQTTFKAIAETFRGYWHQDNFAVQLMEWQAKNLIILPKFIVT